MFIDGDAAALLTTFGTAYSLLVTGGKIQNSKKLPFSGHINQEFTVTTENSDPGSIFVAYFRLF
jgi:hypothetical protein